MMVKCGLLGRKLTHSYSPAIHGRLADYAYDLYEKEEDEIEAFLADMSIKGLNVTIPYKKTVFPYLDEVSDVARRTGSVNTIVRRDDGSLFGDNTDVYGFAATVRRAGCDVMGKKVLVLGSGGASAAVCAALDDMGAETVVISRSGENNYDNLERHADAAVIVNTTPLGMYPNTGVSPLDLRRFSDLDAVFDVIYNPAKTALLLQAEELGIPCDNGLYMLVAQAKRSAEQFAGTEIDDSKIDSIYAELLAKMQNIVLVGMPGVGKSTVAAKISKMTGRKIIDTDDEIKARTGKTPAQIINESGEEEFRRIESSVIADAGKGSGAVIATGGGIVTREVNYASLHQNGVIVWLKRDLAGLAQGNRPLTQKHGVEELYRVRAPLYRRFADAEVELCATSNASAKKILNAFEAEVRK